VRKHKPNEIYRGEGNWQSAGLQNLENTVRFRAPLPEYPGVAQSGSATVLGTVGREFESHHPDQNIGSVQQTKTLNQCMS
jgi:hypothetical protein